MPDRDRRLSADEIIERYVEGPARPGKAVLQNATNCYTEKGISGPGAGAAGGATPAAADTCSAMLQNATNPEKKSAAVTNEANGGAPGAPSSAAAPAGLPATSPGTLAPLDPRQREAIELILLGKSDRAVAASVKVHRVTVTRWRLYDVSFQAALNRRREERWNSAEERVRGLVRRAVGVLGKQLRSDDAQVSYRAARALVQMAGAGRFAPQALPTDPAAVLDYVARGKHIERCSDDPRTERLSDRDRWMALKDLRARGQRLEQQEGGAS